LAQRVAERGMIVGIGEARDVELAAQREIVRYALGDAEEV
jgi:hypothetical protein